MEFNASRYLYHLLLLVTPNVFAVFSSFGIANKVDFLFSQLQEQNVQPDDITFVTLLNTYNHTHNVKRALECYTSMENDYKIVPNERHKAIIIDTLGRAGQLAQAEQKIYGTYIFMIYGLLFCTC